MVLFEESFADPAELMHDWIVASPSALTYGLCAPPWVSCFEPSVPSSTTWSNSISPTTRPSSGFTPLSVVARGNKFEVFLGEPDGPLRYCASWEDSWHTYRQGAVGVWEHGGEAGEYRSLRVEELGGTR